MTREEILKDDWVANNYGDRARNWIDLAFLDGVEWMENQTDDKAVEKTAERTRKETLLEVLNWIEGMYDTDYVAGDIVRMLKDKLKKLNNDTSQRL